MSHAAMIDVRNALWEMIEEYSHLIDHEFSTHSEPRPSKNDPLIIKAKNALKQFELTYPIVSP